MITHGISVLLQDGGLTSRRQLLDKVAQFYNKAFLKSPKAQSRLRALGIGNPVLWRTFRLGLADGTLLKAVPESGALLDDLKAIGILNANGKEVLRGRLVIPVVDGKNETIGLLGLLPHGKVITVPKSCCGLVNPAALHSEELLLCETVLDSFALWESGWKNAVALQTLGGNLDILRRGEIESVCLVMRQGKARGIGKKLKEVGIAVLNVDVPDVLRFIRKHGADKFNALMKSARVRSVAQGAENAVVENKQGGFMLRFRRRTYEIILLENSPTKVRATIKALTQDRNRFHIDTVDVLSAKSRKSFVEDAAGLYHEDAATITSDLNAIIVQCEKAAESTEPEPRTVARVSEEDKRQAERFGKRGDLLDAIARDIQKCGYVGEKSNVLLAYLAMCSRKMENPMALLVVSSSGAGKSALQDAILALCPDEDVVRLTALTEKALFYKSENSLQHKVLALEEKAGADDADYAIRNLVSAKVLIIESTVKDPTTGRLTAMQNRVYGPTAVFETTTSPHINPETKSRFIVVGMDESREQTRRILEAQRQARTAEGLNCEMEKAMVRKKHHAFQRLLKPVAVLNPYASKMSFSDDRLSARRDQPKYLAIIETIAFVRQMRKQIRTMQARGKAQEYIEVDLADIADGNKLATEILGRSRDELSQPSRKLLAHIREMKKTFSRRELRESCRWSDYQVRTYLKPLVDLEYVERVTGRNGQRHSYRLVGSGTDMQESLGIVDANALKRVRKPCET